MVGMDKVGRDTGPGDGGFLVTDLDTPGTVEFEFILSNYNIDGNMLKPEHKTLLNQHIVPFLKLNRYHAEMTGTASRTGDAAYNRQLSRERVSRVRAYLLRQGLADAQVPLRDMHAVGEDKSTSKFDEDELERSVRISIVVGVRPAPAGPGVVVPQIVPPNGNLPPAPPQVVPETVIVIDTREPWAIQELTGFNGGVGAGGNVGPLNVGVQVGTIEYHFLLFNRRTKQMSQCRFFGAAISGGPSLGKSWKPGFSAGPGFSITKGSHTWDQFFTKAGTGFDAFAGAATWFEPFSLALNTDISAKAILKLDSLGISIEVSTGVTIGTSGSAAARGDFFLKPPVQLNL